MDTKTYQLKGKELKPEWHLVDAKDYPLGRLSTLVATYLIGKNRTDYTPNIDARTHVVVVNAKNVKLTGKKLAQKVYRSHSGYPGGLREVSAQKLMAENPMEIVRKAVSGMLPDNRLKKKRLARLKIYNDGKHPYAEKFKAQG